MTLRPGEKKTLVTVGALALGTAVLTLWIVDRDRIRERAHELAQAGRGQYK
jgi:hypothetical protein